MKFVLPLVAVPLLLTGGQGLYSFAHNRQPVTVTCAELERGRHRALWLRAMDCELDYLNPGYRESRGRLTELFFPVRAAGEPASSPATMVAVTKDPAVLAVAASAIGSGNRPDQESFLVAMLRVVNMLGASREVDGYVRAGLVDRLRTRRTLAGLNTPLAPGYIVVDMHSRPGLLVPALEAAGGVLALLTFVVLLARRKRPQQVLVPASPLPYMMALNLPDTATPADIEHAPPLGTTRDVRKCLRAAAALKFDSTGRARREAPDHWLQVDIGKSEPVWTATITAEGTGAVHALLAVADATGWQLYIPKRGLFLRPGVLDEGTASPVSASLP